MQRRRDVGSLGAFRSLTLAHSEVTVLSITTAVVALLLGFGGLQEFLVRGIWNRELQPLVIGALGALVSALLLVAAIAIWRRWSLSPRVAATAGALSIAFHTYGALNPEHNVGMLAMLSGVGIGIALLVYVARRREPELRLTGR